MDIDVVERSIETLHPVMRSPVRMLQLALHEQGSKLRLFETYRSPERQAALLFRRTTKAQAWQSPHQYGLAADFVWHDGDGWSWERVEGRYELLGRLAASVGLAQPIVWDPYHIEHPAFLLIKGAWRR